MQALSDLRTHLLDQLEIAAENLTTFIESGSVESWPNQGGNPDANKNFRLPYRGIIYVDKPKEPPQFICWVLAEWMNKRFPDRDVKTSIQFEADILSHTDSILEFTVELYDEYAVEVSADGVTKITPFLLDELEPARDVCLFELGKYEPASP